MDMKTGTILFWTGFAVTMGFITAYLILLCVCTTVFTEWLISLVLCGAVIAGAVMMVIGRAIERNPAEL